MLDVFKEGAGIKDNFSECEAFFISPDNGFFDLSKNNVSNHIGLIINNPEKFGVTTNYIQSIYEKYNEKTGTEGSAREEIILEIVKKGWIRGRHYLGRNDYWSINVYEATKRNEAVIYHIAKLVSDKVIDRIGSLWSSFNILETKTGNIMNYTASDILNSKLYNHFFKEDFKGKREEILASNLM